MSPSMHHRSPMRRGSSSSDSPVRGRGSPRRRSSPRRDKSPDRRRTSSRARSPTREKEKLSSRGRSPKKSGRSISPMSRSPSPRSKRLRRAHVERDDDRVNDRERKRNSSREDGRQRERGGDREDQSDRREKRSAKEDTDKGRNSSREDGRHRERGEDREDQSDRREKRSAKEDTDKGRNSSREDGRHRERGEDREDQSDRREKRSVKEDIDKGSSRSRHRRSASPMERSYRNRSHSSRSPARGSRSRTHDEESIPRGSEHHGDGEEDSVAKMKAAEEALEAKKQKPSFELSGKLAAETNRVKGVTLLFTEPSDARKPDVRWRLYVFKAGEVLNEPLYIHRQSCYLFGRERRVADVPTDHPSCSKQHAVIQFRQVEKEKPDGMMMKQVRPYIMDLGSTNGTFINDNRVEPQRYYELMEKDTIKFGNSSREYVILHENSSED